MSSRRRRACCAPGDPSIPDQPLDHCSRADLPPQETPAPRAHRRQAAPQPGVVPDSPPPEARPARRRRPPSSPTGGDSAAAAVAPAIDRRSRPSLLPEDSSDSCADGQRPVRRRRAQPSPQKHGLGLLALVQRTAGRRKQASPQKDSLGAFALAQRAAGRWKQASPQKDGLDLIALAQRAAGSRRRASSQKDGLGAFALAQRTAGSRRRVSPQKDGLGAFALAQRAAGSRRRASSQKDGLGSFSLQTRRRRKSRPTLRWIAVALLGMMAAFSLMMVTGILWRSVRTRHLNAELSRRRAQLTQAEASAMPGGSVPSPGQPSPEPTVEPAGVSALADAAKILPEQTEPPAPVVRSTVYHRVGGTALPHMEALHGDNHDLIGWISIPQVLDLPVMYKDNSYYLTHDFNGQKNTSGCIFLDVNHRFGEHTQNLLLHGHNMKDGTMFGRLVQYAQNIDFFQRNAIVDYDTLWERDQYVMFAVLRVSLDVHDERFFNYFSFPSFETDEAFERYVRELQLRSIYAVPLDVSPSDALLTLSTCIDEDRLVIVCRRVREGEKHSQLERTLRLSVRQ